jgi:hypothetical protein
MPQASGSVGYIGSKVFNGRTFHSFKLDGDDNWYRTGMQAPEFKKGDVLSFPYEINQYGNQVDLKDVTVMHSADSTPTETTVRGNKSYAKKPSGSSRDEYWENKAKEDIDRQKIISYQAAMNTAVNIVQVAVALDALPISGSTKPKRWESLNAVIQGVAQDLVRSYMAAPQTVAELMEEGVNGTDASSSTNNDNNEENWDD